MIKKRTEKARKMQRSRFKKLPYITNAEMSSEAVKKFCPLDSQCKTVLKQAVEQMHLSARSYFRILKMARTIADIEGENELGLKHVTEALQYRPDIE